MSVQLFLGLLITSGIYNEGFKSNMVESNAMLMSEKILLSEVAFDGEFIEIYNPNNQAVDLSDFYLTDATFSPSSQFYYTIVNGSNPGGGGFQDFHARFPDGASIGAGEYQTMSLLGSDHFIQTFGMNPTYELFEDNGSADLIPDMREAFSGSINNQGILSNSGEVAILYKWDGLSDLVQDVDYVVWGDKNEAVDKSGVSIDGPDANADNSTYQNETIIASQDIASTGATGLGLSIHRIDYSEGTQTTSGGNGITGGDETSENLSSTWTTLTAPTPNAGEECNSIITLDFELISEQYNANMTINAPGAIVKNGVDVILAYGNDIVLSDDFTVEQGGILTTLFQFCK